MPTSLAVVSIDSNGQPDYRLYRQGIADIDASAAEVIDKLPRRFAVFHTGSLALTPDQVAKTRRLIEAARARGAIISIDLNVRMHACADTDAYLEGVWSVIPMADILKASDEDLRSFAQKVAVSKIVAKAYTQLGHGILVVTNGEHGSTIYSRNGMVSCEAHRAEPFVDTVGAGDVFLATFIARFLEYSNQHKGMEEAAIEVLESALAHASAAAALNLQSPGCNPPTRAQISDRVEAN